MIILIHYNSIPVVDVNWPKCNLRSILYYAGRKEPQAGLKVKSENFVEKNIEPEAVLLCLSLCIRY